MADELSKQIERLATERGRLQTLIDHLQEGVIAINAKETVIEANAVAAQQLNVDLKILRDQALWENCRIDDLNQIMTKAVNGEVIKQEVVYHRDQTAFTL